MKQKRVNRSLWTKIGPGVITGAADDDPSGIATYSQAGAQFGLSCLWTVVLTYPLMVSIQEISARLGRVTGHGIAGNLKRHSTPALLYFSVFLLLVANILNLAADIGAMAEAVRLLLGGNYFIYVILMGAFSALLQVFIPYHRYVFFLKWLTFSLLSYIAVVFFIHVPWSHLLQDTFIPKIHFSSEYFKVVVAIFGTTISPYLFFWQSSQEVEDVIRDPRKKPLNKSPKDAPKEFERIEIDTYVGMFLSNLVAYAIILVAGLTLNPHGITEIDTAAKAAKALEPFAGHLSTLFFSLGIIGTGLLAMPVLAGSAAYAIGEARNWPVGLEKKPNRAKRFYSLIVFATLIGMGIDFLKMNPIKALFYSALLNGIIAVPLMVVIMLLTTNPKVMKNFRLSKPLRFWGWTATFVMALSLVGLFL